MAQAADQPGSREYVSAGIRSQITTVPGRVHLYPPPPHVVRTHENPSNARDAFGVIALARARARSQPPRPPMPMLVAHSARVARTSGEHALTISNVLRTAGVVERRSSLLPPQPLTMHTTTSIDGRRRI